MEIITINIAVEDRLSEAVIKKIITSATKPYAVGACFCRGGCGYLKKNIRGFNNAAKASPFIVLADLDKNECAPSLIKAWLPIPRHCNLLFRIAEKEIESWIIALMARITILFFTKKRQR